MSGQFAFMASLGATPEAVAVLNDQPRLFTTLVVVLAALSLEGLLIWFIHHATLKPEQKKKKADAKATKKNKARGRFFQRRVVGK